MAGRWQVDVCRDQLQQRCRLRRGDLARAEGPGALQACAQPRRQQRGALSHLLQEVGSHKAPAQGGLRVTALQPALSGRMSNSCQQAHRCGIHCGVHGKGSLHHNVHLRRRKLSQVLAIHNAVGCCRQGLHSWGDQACACCCLVGRDLPARL